MTNGQRPLSDFIKNGRIVIVGASLAGLSGAEALRSHGFAGKLTIIGDEASQPYDRPPLSKTVLSGWLSVEQTILPQPRNIEAEWLLGVPATGLDLSKKTVKLADKREIGFDRLLIATGTRARPWPIQEQASLDGVFLLRTQEDAQGLRARLEAKPRRVLVIGAGFTGSEVASVCRDLDINVTVVERSPTPLAGALGQAAGTVAALLQRHRGVDLRCNTTVMELKGDANGKLRGALLSDGDLVEADVAVVALGTIRNVEWLEGSGLVADPRGIVCDASCRVFNTDGMVTDNVFVAGDVARWPHPRYSGIMLEVEHWGNAVSQAEIAAHNMLVSPQEFRAHKSLPSFWSNQFGANIKLVGIPSIADQIIVTQGRVPEMRFVAAYGKQGRMVAAIAVNSPRWLPAYELMIEEGAPFPPKLNASYAPEEARPIEAGFPPPRQATHSPEAVSTGPGPSTPVMSLKDLNDALSDPRVPPGVRPL